MRHACIIPLIGGFPLAAEELFNTPPLAVYSFKDFIKNDRLYLNYKPNVPYYDINGDYKVVKDLDIVYGTPPCSGLSTASTTIKKDTSGVNNWMMLAGEFALSILKPRVYIFENAPGLFTNIGVGVRKELYSLGSKYGYSVTFYRTNTLLHGVPQNRVRTYIIFSKGTKAPYLGKIHKDYENISDYLSRKPISYKYDSLYATKFPYFHQYDTVSFLKMLLGDNWRNIIIGEGRNNNNLLKYMIKVNLLPDLKSYTKDEKLIYTIDHIMRKRREGKGFRSQYGNIMLYRNYVGTVFGGSMWFMAHPKEDRIMNIGEYMWLMGLPLDMELQKTDYQRIGQNVPLQTSMDILEGIRMFLNGEGAEYSDNYLMQNNIKGIL